MAAGLWCSYPIHGAYTLVANRGLARDMVESWCFPAANPGPRALVRRLLPAPLIMNHTTLGAAGALLAFSAATTACSTATTATSAPRLGSPATSTAALPCRVTGSPVVLATRVFVPRGVEVLARHAHFEVRFAAAAFRCLAVAWPSASRAREDVSCPPTSVDADVTAASAMEATFGSGSRVASALPLLGVSMRESSQRQREGQVALVERPVGASLGGPDGGEVTELVPVGSNRFLRLSIEGGLESHQLGAQVFASSGEAVGPVFDVSPQDASVIGRPSAAIEPGGAGWVTYIASTGDEFGVFATPISCATR
jgi:hypothetical protein